MVRLPRDKTRAMNYYIPPPMIKVIPCVDYDYGWNSLYDPIKKFLRLYESEQVYTL